MHPGQPDFGLFQYENPSPGPEIRQNNGPRPTQALILHAFGFRYSNTGRQELFRTCILLGKLGKWNSDRAGRCKKQQPCAPKHAGALSPVSPRSFPGGLWRNLL